jgi:adenosine deaminase
MTTTLTDEVRNIPKAELHVHIEGTITPDMARKKALQNDITLPEDLFNDDGTQFRFKDFLDLVVNVYDIVASTIRSGSDYDDITYDYLKRSYDEGCIYTEFIVSADHADMVGVGYEAMLEGMTQAIDRARNDFGVEARINSSMVRHFPIEQVDAVADRIISSPHKYVVGVDLAGGELEGDVSKFKPMFDRIAQNTDLGIRLHGAENAGPVNGWLSLEVNPSRIGHGVRCIEDDKLVDALIKNNVMLEVCPTSNVLAGIYETYAQHPMRQLKDRGVKISINSDDPGLFNCTIGSEYQVAKDHFGFTNEELLEVTKDSLHAAFVDAQTRDKLLSMVETYNAPNGNPTKKPNNNLGF